MKEACFHLGLIGYPLSHSRSPELHHQALASYGLAGEYRLFPHPPTDEGLEKIKGLLEDVRRGNIQGLNVTIPHKQNVIPFLDRLTDVAQAVGAVNTLYLDPEGQLTGDNTDVPGFLHDVRQVSGKQAGRALVLGAGGSARAVVYALAKSGWQVQVLARCERQAVELVQAIGQTNDLAERMRANVLSSEMMAAANWNLMVNTTPLGMYPDSGGCPWPEEIPFPIHAAVYDLIYNPRETVLVSRAKAAGLPARNGAGMLVAQAALAFQMWTGLEPPFEAMQTVFD